MKTGSRLRVFISIKYYPDQHNQPLIQSVSALLEERGWETFCVVRDIEQWGTVHFNPQELMQRTFEAIRACDLLLVELSEKGVGVGIEAGYAHALGKPILVIAGKEADISTTLEGIAAHTFQYGTIEQVGGWIDHLPI